MPKRPDTLKVGVIVGNNFNGKELAETLAVLEENNVYVEMISETLQPVTCATGTEFTIDQTFLTFSPYLVDALYVVGGDAKNNDKFMYDIRNFIQVVYDYYKPIAVASTAEMYIQHIKKNNLSGVVFANYNDHFHHDFIEAITKQRFWERKKRLGQNQS